MIVILLVLALFICVSSIFFKELRKLAAAIIATGLVFAFSVFVLMEIIVK